MPLLSIADLLLFGTLHTLDPQRPRAQAALIQGGKFTCVGSQEECRKRAPPGVRVLDLGAGSATPGLADAHGHVGGYGRSLLEVACGGAKSAEECASRAAAKAKASPKGAWVRGRGWDQNLWEGGAFPTAAQLSRQVPEHPAVIWRIDGHAIWANERAMQLAGITKETRDPPGGRIVRDASGSPTGVLIDNAENLIKQALPLPGDAEVEAQLVLAMSELVKLGLTSVGDCGVPAHGLQIYRKLAEQGRLPLRIYALIDGQAPRAELAAQLRAWSKQQHLGRLSVRAVKLYADGALGSRGAMLFEPYSDEPGNSGLAVTAPDELAARIEQVARAGFQPCIHAIGDRACSNVLHDFARIGKEMDLKSLRPRVEHLQILQPRDLPLLKASGAIASMQPTHATSDAPWAEARLGHGTRRQKGAYAWRSVLEAEVSLACGSDFPIESPDPRGGLYSAEVRRPAGAPRDAPAWMPEQRLTRQEAVRCFSQGVAYAEHAENHRGMIREGYSADVTAYTKDIFSISAEELPSIPIAATIVEGEVVFLAK